MADSISTTLKAIFSSVWTEDKTLDDPKHTIAVQESIKLTYGTGAGEANLHWAKEATLAGGATETLDLVGSTADEFGNVLSFAKIKAIIIQSTAAGSADAALLIGGAASAQFLALFGDVSDKIRLRAGATLILICADDDATGYAPVATTGDLFKIANEGAASCTYRIGIVGVST